MNFQQTTSNFYKFLTCLAMLNASKNNKNSLKAREKTELSSLSPKVNISDTRITRLDEKGNLVLFDEQDDLNEMLVTGVGFIDLKDMKTPVNWQYIFKEVTACNDLVWISYNKRDSLLITEWLYNAYISYRVRPFKNEELNEAAERLIGWLEICHEHKAFPYFIKEKKHISKYPCLLDG